MRAESLAKKDLRLSMCTKVPTIDTEASKANTVRANTCAPSGLKPVDFSKQVVP